MANSLLSSLKQQVLPKSNEVKEVTNSVYKGMLEVRNNIIREKQQRYYEAYNNASKVNVG